MSAAGRTYWGFHQLRASQARALVAAAGVRPGDLVVDIGAGTGAITEHLVASGARVIAVELHPFRAQLLRRRFAGHPVTVVAVDAEHFRLPHQPFRVVANPPFAAVVGILRGLTAPRSRLVRADLVVPGYVAGRWSAGRAPGSARWCGTYEVQVARQLPVAAMCPPSPRPAAHLVIRRRGSAERQSSCRAPR